MGFFPETGVGSGEGGSGKSSTTESQEAARKAGLEAQKSGRSGQGQAATRRRKIREQGDAVYADLIERGLSTANASLIRRKILSGQLVITTEGGRAAAAAEIQRLQESEQQVAQAPVTQVKEVTVRPEAAVSPTAIETLKAQATRLDPRPAKDQGQFISRFIQTDVKAPQFGVQTTPKEQVRRVGGITEEQKVVSAAPRDTSISGRLLSIARQRASERAVRQAFGEKKSPLSGLSPILIPTPSVAAISALRPTDPTPEILAGVSGAAKATERTASFAKERPLLAAGIGAGVLASGGLLAALPPAVGTTVAVAGGVTAGGITTARVITEEDPLRRAQIVGGTTAEAGAIAGGFALGAKGFRASRDVVRVARGGTQIKVMTDIGQGEFGIPQQKSIFQGVFRARPLEATALTRGETTRVVGKLGERAFRITQDPVKTIVEQVTPKGKVSFREVIATEKPARVGITRQEFIDTPQGFTREAKTITDIVLEPTLRKRGFLVSELQKGEGQILQRVGRTVADPSTPEFRTVRRPSPIRFEEGKAPRRITEGELSGKVTQTITEEIILPELPQIRGPGVKGLGKRAEIRTGRTEPSVRPDTGTGGARPVRPSFRPSEITGSLRRISQFGEKSPIGIPLTPTKDLLSPGSTTRSVIAPRAEPKTGPTGEPGLNPAVEVISGSTPSDITETSAITEPGIDVTPDTTTEAPPDVAPQPDIFLTTGGPGVDFRFTPLPPFVPPTLPPGIPPLAFGGFGRGRPFDIQRKGRQRRELTPTLTAAVFDIEGPSTKLGVLTGLGLRPFPKKPKKKKKRGN